MRSPLLALVSTATLTLALVGCSERVVKKRIEPATAGHAPISIGAPIQDPSTFTAITAGGGVASMTPFPWK